MKKTLLLIIPLIFIFAGCAPWEKGENSLQVNTNSNSSINEGQVKDAEEDIAEEESNINEELVETEASDWLTYENEGYGYVVKYPMNWKTQINEQERCWLVASQETMADNNKWNTENSDFDINYLHFYDFAVCPVSNPDGLSLSDWFTTLRSEVRNIEYLDIGNTSGAKYTDNLGKDVYILNLNGQTDFLSISRNIENENNIEQFNEMIDLFTIK